MAAHELIVDPVFRYRVRLRNEGRVLRGEFWVEPGGGGAIDHAHPTTEERFEVVRGEVTYRVGRSKREAHAGDRFTVPAGARHSFLNTGSDEAHLVVEMEPAADLESMFREVAALAQAGRWRRIGRLGVPTGPRALVDMADFLWRYRGSFVLSFPPRVLQWPVVALIGRLAQRRSGARGAIG